MPNFGNELLDPWFVDNDDGTIIHLFDPIAREVNVNGVDEVDFDFSSGNRCIESRISFEQNITPNNCDSFDGGTTEVIDCSANGGDIFSIGSFKLDVTPALPSDMSFHSGSISRFSDRLSLFLEEFTPSRASYSTTLVGINFFRPTKTFITRYDFINVESLGNSNGTANQQFTISGSLIKAPTKGTPIVTVGGTKWAKVNDFSSSSSIDQVYTYNETTGTITFGNGVNGAIPANESEIVLRITIRNGGGTWEYQGIVQNPKNTINIGGVKSVKDKVFYQQAPIIAADVSHVTTIHSELNVHHSKCTGFNTGELLAERHIWNFYHGGQATISSPGEVLFNIGTLTNFVDSKANTDAISTHTTHGVVEINTDWPNMKAETFATAIKPAGFSGGINHSVIPRSSNLSVGATYCEWSKLRGGVITSPKNYRLDLTIYPIVQVVEIIRHGVAMREDDGMGGFTPWTFVSAPAYWLFFGCFGPHSGESTAVRHQSGTIAVTDSDGTSFNESLVQPIAHASAGSGRATRQIQIADVVGSFSSPVPNNWNFTVSTLDTKQGRGSFVRRVAGDTTRHPEWVKIIDETQTLTQRNKDYHIHIVGSPLPEFTTLTDAIPGDITTFNNTIAEDNKNVPPFSGAHDDGFGRSGITVSNGVTIVFYDPVYSYLKTFAYPAAVLSNPLLNVPTVQDPPGRVLRPRTVGVIEAPTDHDI